MQSVPDVRAYYKEQVASFKDKLHQHDPTSEGFWNHVADQFPNPRWFGTGTNGLSPHLVMDAINDFNRIPEGFARWHHYWPWQEETISNVADFIGADAEEIGLVDNATVGMNYIANGLRVPAGSRVVVTDFEHPGGFKPWERYDPRTDQPVYEMVWAKLPVEDATPASITDAILAAVDVSTAAVEFSHIDRYRGFRLPAAKIVSRIREKAPNAFITIDGAQSVGSIAVDVHAIGCDALVTGFHKWAFGPKGTGCVYVRKDKLDRVASTLGHSREEWAGVNAKLTFSSTVNWGIRFATEVALDFQRAIGLENITNRMLQLGDYFLAGVADIPGLIVYSPSEPENRSPIVTIAFDADDTLYQTFEEKAHAAGLLAWSDSVPGRGSCFRLPLHVYNTPAAIDDLVKVVHEIWA